jgi:hypothetical protein
MDRELRSGKFNRQRSHEIPMAELGRHLRSEDASWVKAQQLTVLIQD